MIQYGSAVQEQNIFPVKIHIPAQQCRRDIADIHKGDPGITFRQQRCQAAAKGIPEDNQLLIETDATERLIEWYLPKSSEFLASPGGKLVFLSSGTSEPVDKKD